MHTSMWADRVTMIETENNHSVKKNLIKRLQKSSCHGVSHFANASNRYTKSYWFFWSFCCLSAMLYFLIIRISDFLNSSVTTSFLSEKVDSIEMPRVTICSINNYEETDFNNILGNIIKVMSDSIVASSQTDTVSIKLFLIDYLHHRVNLVHKNNDILTTNVSYHVIFGKAHNQYTNKILMPNLIEDKSPDLESKIYDSFSVLLYEYDYISKGRNFKCRDEETVERKFYNFVNPEGNFSYTKGQGHDLKYYLWESVYNSSTSTNMDMNITIEDKCKYILYGPFISKPEYRIKIIDDYSVKEALVGEIILFLLSATGTQPIKSQTILDIYGPYFETVFGLVDLEEFFEYFDTPNLHAQNMQLPLEQDKAFYKSKHTDFYKKELMPIFDEFKNKNDSDISKFEILIKIISKLKQLKRKVFEAPRKAFFMDEITDFSSNPESPKNYEIFNKIMVNAEWSVFSNKNGIISEQYDNQIENLTISEADKYYQRFEPETNVFQTRFDGKGISENNVSGFDQNSSSFFKKTSTPRSSNCIQTIHQNFSQTTPGHKNGYSFIFFTGYADLNLLKTTDDIANPIMFQVTIDDYKERFIDSSGLNSFLLENGRMKQIGLRKKVKRLASQFGRCDGQQKESLNDCKQMCFLKQISESRECDCTPNYGIYMDLDFVKNRTECTFETLSASPCYQFIKNFKSQSTSQIQEICGCNQPCQVISYEQKIKSAPNQISASLQILHLTRFYDEWLSKDIKTMVNDYVTYVDKAYSYLWRVLISYVFYNKKEKMITKYSAERDDVLFSQGVAMLQIYFEEMEVEFIEENLADPASSLVSDLGGQLGLWLGISMVSIMEIFLIFYVFFKWRGQRTR